MYLNLVCEDRKLTELHNLHFMGLSKNLFKIFKIFLNFPEIQKFEKKPLDIYF